jgi:vesicle coat complex subunit
MASLVTDEDKHGFTGMLADHFDTFKQEIVVFKAPVKVLQNVTSNDSYAGYGESSNQQEFEYVSVSGVYNAIVNYNNPKENVSYYFSLIFNILRLEEDGEINSGKKIWLITMTI